MDKDKLESFMSKDKSEEKEIKNTETIVMDKEFITESGKILLKD